LEGEIQWINNNCASKKDKKEGKKQKYIALSVVKLKNLPAGK
jgi:hypothetical protein